MASAQDLRKRIKSVTNTQQITKAMKMVASARLRRAQTKAQATAPYAAKLGEILTNVAGSAEEVTNALLEVRPVKRVGYLVIGADKGLAGPYTSNLMKFVMSEIADKSKDSYAVVTVGRKPLDYLSHRKIPISASYSGFSDQPTYEHAEELVRTVVDSFVKEEVDEVVMIYTHFVNSLTQEVRRTQLLPVQPVTTDDATQTQYIFVPSAVDIFADLLPKFLGITVYNGMLQSAASELGARMTAMTSATDNATELISSLDLEYNKLRQAGITNEISEIVGGANALQ